MFLNFVPLTLVCKMGASYSLSKYFLSVYYVSGTVLVTDNVSVTPIQRKLKKNLYPKLTYILTLN
jgi:hypothetical protein